MSFHGDLKGERNIHVPNDFEYPDETAREAATGFVTGDLNKLALQLDNFTLWILTAITPVWVRVGNPAGSGDVVGPGSSTDNALARYDGVSGQSIQNSNALLNDAGDLTIIGSILSQGRAVSTNPAILIDIFSSADLDALATGGIITVSSGTELVLRMKASSITTSNRFVVEDNASLSLIGNRPSALTYSGALTFFTGGTSSVGISGMVILETGGGTLFSMISLDPVNAELSIDRCQFIGWTLGTLDRILVIVTFSIFFDWDSGLYLNNGRILLASGILFDQLDDVPVSDSLFKIDTHDPEAVINLHFSTGNLPAGDFFTQINANLHNDARVVIGESVIKGDLFDTSGITGAFTAVADASVAPTTVNSVTDSPSTPGIARFNFTVGPTLFVGQFVDVSAFVTNPLYNQGGLVTATGAGFFEILPVAFGSNEVGSFKSDSVTLTETATGASEGLGITIDTDQSTDYDGGVIVYNKLVNSFEIHRVFTVTHTGSWSAEGLDERDPRVIAVGNPGQRESSHIASAFVNENTTVNGEIDNGEFADMDFGTVGDALVVGSNIERWKLIDEVFGIFEYTGNEPFDGVILFNFTSTSSGASVEFRWKWLHDIGAGFVDLPDPVITSNDVGATAGNTTLVIPLRAVKGDQIKPQITRITGTSDITASFVSIVVQ